jgi:hypothetical protein
MARRTITTARRRVDAGCEVLELLMEIHRTMAAKEVTAAYIAGRYAIPRRKVEDLLAADATVEAKHLCMLARAVGMRVVLVPESE